MRKLLRMYKCLLVFHAKTNEFHTNGMKFYTNIAHTSNEQLYYFLLRYTTYTRTESREKQVIYKKKTVTLSKDRLI